MRTALLFLFLSLVACSGETGQKTDFSTREVVRVVSPSGCCEAHVVESTLVGVGENTQVIVSFDGGSCGAGVASADGINRGLDIRWVNELTLSIGHPRGVQLTQNASGDRVKCGRHEVHVLLREME